jgi:galactose-1-phosphate uridylyltransferase
MPKKSPVPTCPAFPYEDLQSSHLLQDPTTGDWVIVAPGRRYRVSDSSAEGALKQDPFSPESLLHEQVLGVVGKGVDRVTAIENKFPVFHPHRELLGRQEILVEGEDMTPFRAFSLTRIENVLEAMAQRALTFRKDRHVKTLITFKNEGREAGATQMHAHSQMYGLPFVPARMSQLAERRAAARKNYGAPAHAIALRDVTAERTIYRDARVVAFVHPAARFSYEVRILTLRRIDNLIEATKDERASLAKALFSLLPFIREKDYSFNFYFHDVFGYTDEYFELRFTPRVTIWAGFELDAGIAVNTVPAECAAEEYRMAEKSSQK